MVEAKFVPVPAANPEQPACMQIGPHSNSHVGRFTTGGIPVHAPGLPCRQGPIDDLVKPRVKIVFYQMLLGSFLRVNQTDESNSCDDW